MLILSSGLSSQANPKGAFVWGWLFQTTAFVGTFWWIYISLHVYGEMPSGLALFAVLSLAAFLALYWAVLSGLFHAFSIHKQATGGNVVRVSVLFAACWMLCELARAVWFTGFPWGSSGYAHTLGVLSNLAPWVGVYGIGAVSAGMSMFVVRGWTWAWRGIEPQASKAIWKKTIWTSALLLILGINAVPIREKGVVPEVRSPNERGLQISLLQGNVAQENKFSSAQQEAIAWYTHALLNEKADLVITPETAFAQVAQSMPDAFWRGLIEHSNETKTSLLMGIPVGDEKGLTNSALGILPQKLKLYRYDKSHLVPFGEFLPPFFKWFTDQMKMPLGSFRFGDDSQESMQVGQERVAPNICYEDLFGEELASRFVNPKLAPTVMVNMSNIAWFGDTVIVDQHLEISRMRTLELERPMIRATNSGATVVIDEQGQLRASLKSFERGVLRLEVKGVDQRPSFFAWWAGRFGLWPLWIVAILILVLEGWRSRRERESLKNQFGAVQNPQ
jgi:apolipoprotein N-acyltransferase